MTSITSRFAATAVTVSPCPSRYAVTVVTCVAVGPYSWVNSVGVR